MTTNNPFTNYTAIPDEYPNNFLQCRTDGHHWQKPRTVPQGANVPYGYPEYRVCLSCGQFRARSFDHWMVKVYERRFYPANYLLEGVGYPDERPGRKDFRRVQFKRDEVEYIPPPATDISVQRMKKRKWAG